MRTRKFTFEIYLPLTLSDSKTEKNFKNSNTECPERKLKFSHFLLYLTFRSQIQEEALIKG